MGQPLQKQDVPTYLWKNADGSYISVALAGNRVFESQFVNPLKNISETQGSFWEMPLPAEAMTLFTQGDLKAIEVGMTYEQVAKLLQHPGYRGKLAPSAVYFWTKPDGTKLDVRFLGEKIIQIERTNNLTKYPEYNRVNFDMTEPQVLKMLGQPSQRKKFDLYSWYKLEKVRAEVYFINGKVATALTEDKQILPSAESDFLSTSSYDKIQLGETYEQVLQLLGSPVQQNSVTRYFWYNNKCHPLIVTFLGNRIVSIDFMFLDIVNYNLYQEDKLYRQLDRLNKNLSLKEVIEILGSPAVKEEITSVYFWQLPNRYSLILGFTDKKLSTYLVLDSNGKIRKLILDEKINSIRPSFPNKIIAGSEFSRLQGLYKKISPGMSYQQVADLLSGLEQVEATQAVKAFWEYPDTSKIGLYFSPSGDISQSFSFFPRTDKKPSTAQQNLESIRGMLADEIYAAIGQPNREEKVQTYIWRNPHGASIQVNFQDKLVQEKSLEESCIDRYRVTSSDGFQFNVEFKFPFLDKRLADNCF